MLGAKEARKQRSETTGRHLDRILQDYCKPGATLLPRKPYLTCPSKTEASYNTVSGVTLAPYPLLGVGLDTFPRWSGTDMQVRDKQDRLSWQAERYQKSCCLADQAGMLRLLQVQCLVMRLWTPRFQVWQMQLGLDDLRLHKG